MNVLSIPTMMDATIASHDPITLDIAGDVRLQYVPTLFISTSEGFKKAKVMRVVISIIQRIHGMSTIRIFTV